ncbi:MAG: 4Fe-4S binding protein [Deltaproteobacteria bacterium]|nr:4Fe-4S binding protein [Candidatus Zymogenaceae bacterium]
MTDVYKRLASKLDDLPNGFPATETGVELKILEKIFSPADAETALLLKALPETAETVAERLGRSVSEMELTLDAMAEKGQIGCVTWGGQRFYLLMPFVVGIYEFQMYRIDRELACLCEQYWPTLHRTVGGFEPALARVVPVNAPIDNKSDIVVYEDVRMMFADAQSFTVHECICRKERKLTGHDCAQPLEVCLSFSSNVRSPGDFSLGGRDISRQEAMAILDDAERRGLVHSAFYNTQTGHFGLCNCCPCCCGLLRGIRELGSPYLLARSNYAARIDPATCSACGVCADERCPVDAIREDNGSYLVDDKRCIGCGVCASACPSGSITLVTRPESEQNRPPENLLAWLYQRAQSRGIDLKFD